jgi:signal transduction histidine kinase
MPGAVGNAVYRILQESITNVIRHVGPTRVTVALDYSAEEVEVRVTDEGPRPGTRIEERADHRPGGGILGMRERCHLLGGEFDAGPRAGKGFAVTARLPLAPAG